MNAAPAAGGAACAVCGHAGSTADCAHCGGSARSLAVGSPLLRPGRGFFAADFVSGFFALFRTALRLLHHRAFIGRLFLPMLTNAVAFALLLAAATCLLQPQYAVLLARPWPFGDGLRLAAGDRGPWLLTLATAWMLGPCLLEAVTGPADEALLDLAEVTIAGDGMRRRPGSAAPMLMRVRDNARVLGALLLLLPPVLLLALVPVVGPLLALPFGAAAAAIAFFEAPLARRGLFLRARLAVLRHNWARALGLGVAFQFGVLVPFFDLLLLGPAASVAAAELYFRFDKDASAD
jgi:uncharacterized protein involved in cysteine biosynthesis